MRLLYCCSELGLGHVTRVIPLGRELEKKGYEIFFFSGGSAYEMLKKEFKNVNYCTPVAWYETARGIAASASLLNILFPLPYYDNRSNRLRLKDSNAMETIHRYYDLRKPIREIKPDLLVSDGDLNALRLANRWNIPAVYITNMIRPSYGFSPFLNPGERFIERYIKKSKTIIIPDNPPPYTISEYNLGDLETMELKTIVEFVGSFIDISPTRGSDSYIFASISGPYGTRSKLTRIILPVLEGLETKSVISLGLPGKKKTAKRGNCEIHTWLSSQERQKVLENSKIIIFSGGHLTCFETIKHSKPTICIPTQPEQMANAAKLQNLGCSISVKNSAELKQATKRLENDLLFFKKNVEKINIFSNGFKGIERATKIISSILN